MNHAAAGASLSNKPFHLTPGLAPFGRSDRRKRRVLPLRRPAGVPRYPRDKDRGLPAPKRDASSMMTGLPTPSARGEASCGQGHETRDRVAEVSLTSRKSYCLASAEDQHIDAPPTTDRRR
jgi:hypothetical protein